MLTFTALHKKRMRAFLRSGLYLVTSEEHSAGRDTIEILRSALEAGVRLVQLREKKLAVSDFFELATRARALTREKDALLVINDRIDIAMAVGADGVHLGQEDFPVEAARRLAPDLIIGASTHSLREAREAQRAGASYINIGPVFATKTKKTSTACIGLKKLRKIIPEVTVPWTVMGGIKPEHIPSLLKAGARTIAVVTAVTSAESPGRAARELLNLILKPRSDALWGASKPYGA